MTPDGLLRNAIESHVRGDYDGAKSCCERALALPPKSDQLTADLLDVLGSAQRDAGDLSAARISYREALEVRRRLFGAESTQVATTLSNLGVLEQRAGRHGEAISLLSPAVATLARVYGQRHPEVARAQVNLGGAYAGAGHLDEARAILRRAVDGFERTVGREHQDSGRALGSLATVCLSRGEYDEARELFDRALAVLTATLGPHHPQTRSVRARLEQTVARRGAELRNERAGVEGVRDHQSGVAGASANVAPGLHDLWSAYGFTTEMQKQPEAMRLALRASMVVFCDGEVEPLHEGRANSQWTDLFGAISLEEGSFVRSLRQTVEDDSPVWREALRQFRSIVAATLAHQVVRNGWMQSFLPSVNLVGDRLLFDGNSHVYDLQPASRARIVVDYGPGLGERFILRENFVAWKESRPFYYIPVTRGPFPNTFAAQCLINWYGADAVSEYLSQGWAIERSDGMLAATTSMLSEPIRGQADLILCSGLQMAARKEVEAGIRNAFWLLREGGVILVRSQRRREPPSSLAIDDMLAMASQAGFSDPRWFESLSAKGKAVGTAIFVKRQAGSWG